MIKEQIPYNKGISQEYLNYAKKDETWHEITGQILKEIINSGKSRFKSQKDIADLFFQVGDRGAWEIIKNEQKLLHNIKAKIII